MSVDIALPFRINGYKFVSELGSGAYSHVFKAVHEASQQFVAIKCISIFELDDEQKEETRKELETLKLIDHPFIISYIDSFEDSQYLYIVTEVAENGTLMELINSYGILTEKQANKLFIQLLYSLDYLKNVVKMTHRDVKAENIMFDKYNNLKLIDFGFSEGIEEESSLKKVKCGTMKYMSPEVVKNCGSTDKSDVWAAGVTLYLLLFASFPFDGNSMHDIFRSILYSTPAFPERTSPELVEMFSNIFNKDEDMRWDTNQVLQSKWIQSTDHCQIQEIVTSEKYLIHNIDETVMQSVTESSSNENESSIIYRIMRKKKINYLVNTTLNPSSVLPFLSIKPDTSKILYNMNIKRSHPAMSRVTIAGTPKTTTDKRHFKNIKSSHAYKIFIDCKK